MSPPPPHLGGEKNESKSAVVGGSTDTDRPDGPVIIHIA